MLRRRMLMAAVRDKYCSVRAWIEMALGMQSSVSSMQAAPVAASADIDFGVDAVLSAQPAAAAAAEPNIDLGMIPQRVDVLDPVLFSPVPEGVNIRMEAEVYVYNKADITMDDGPEIDLIPETAIGAAAQVSSNNDVAIDLRAAASAPDVVYLGGVVAAEIGLQSEADALDAACAASSIDPVEFGADAILSAPDALDILADVGFCIGIEVVLSVLPAAPITAEMDIAIDTAAEPFTEETDWIYPEQTSEYLYIRQVSNIVQEQS